MEEIRKLIREELEILEESRMVTYTSKIASDIGKSIPGVEKVLDIRSMYDGTTALFRYEDGNVYEIQIRPASSIKDKEYYGKILQKKGDPEKKAAAKIASDMTKHIK